MAAQSATTLNLKKLIYAGGPAARGGRPVGGKVRRDFRRQGCRRKAYMDVLAACPAGLYRPPAGLTDVPKKSTL
jgi:hypothetical protein